MRGHFLAVIAVDTFNFRTPRIAGFSNRCGIAAAWCLSAPGVALLVPDSSDGGYRSFDGTSASAPVVSGALAVLMETFRDQLGSTEVVRRLLQTADKTGVYADSSIYGQGMVDLDAATRPVGTTMLTTGISLTGASSPVSMSSLNPGRAFGDALTRGLRGMEVASFDELKAPFFQPLNSFVQPRRAGLTVSGFTDRVYRLGSDPRGRRLPGFSETTRLQVRFDTRNPRHVRAFNGLDTRMTGDATHHGWLDPALRRTHNPQMTSLWWSRDALGPNKTRSVFASVGAHPGWHFGLHGSGFLSPGRFSDTSAFALPYLSLAQAGPVVGARLAAGQGGLQFAAFRGDAGDPNERLAPVAGESRGALVEYRPRFLTPGRRAGSGWALQLGMLRESERSLGTGAAGAFGDLGGETLFTGVTGHWPMGGGWQGFVSAHAGVTRSDPGASPALIKDVASVWTSAFGLGLSRQNMWRSGDQLWLRLAQPLRVESGRATLGWASGRTRAGDLLQQQQSLALTPSGRQMDAELNYSRVFVRAGTLHLAARATRQEGHRATAGLGYALMLRHSLSF